MRRLSVPVLLAALAAAVPALAGCGAEGLAGVDVAQAAQATSDKDTARVKMTMRMSGLGLPQPATLEAEGVTKLAEPQMRMTMDLSALLGSFGADADGRVEMIVDGADFYVDPPKIPGVAIPGDGGWIGLDLREISRALGIDPEAAAVFFRMDPASQLRSLGAAGLNEIGTEEIDGVETTHLKGTASMRDLLDGLPAQKRAAAEKALEQLEELGGGDFLDQEDPTELWVDQDSIVRRRRVTSTVPSQAGTPAGRIDVSYELRDFGAELDVSEPANVTDLTEKLTGLLSAAGLKGRGGTSSG